MPQENYAVGLVLNVVGLRQSAPFDDLSHGLLGLLEILD
jgi:hypothetical protein